MILTMLSIFIVLILVCTLGALILSGAGALILCFGDVIIFGLVIWGIVKIIKKIKKKA